MAGPPLPGPLGLFLKSFGFRHCLAPKIGSLVRAAPLYLLNLSDQLPAVSLVPLCQFSLLCENLPESLLLHSRGPQICTQGRNFFPERQENFGQSRHRSVTIFTSRRRWVICTTWAGSLVGLAWPGSLVGLAWAGSLAGLAWAGSLARVGWRNSEGSIRTLMLVWKDWTDTLIGVPRRSGWRFILTFIR